MIRCISCQTANLDSSRFCDECGSRLMSAAAAAEQIAKSPVVDSQDFDDSPAYVPPQPVSTFQRPVSVTSFGVPPVSETPEPEAAKPEATPKVAGAAHGILIIERGDFPGTEFRLVNDDSTIGRWDADNGIFPDVDLDAHDSDAKVSRRHARILLKNGAYFIEDLGSTNGTYVNRGRRLLPGSPQSLNDGDEVIVGKTFLRFKIAE